MELFSSPKMGDSPRVNKYNLHKTMNETANGIPSSFLQPKITSTPLARRDSVFATPPKPHPLSPRRYSLSDIATPPRVNKKDLSKIHSIGPLLASTKYSVNVSTYEDTKSPGLAGRIVQYNEEAKRERELQRTPTHQAKYGSPGLFPVVHLFKKKLPILEQKPKRVTIRIASPEYSRHSQEYNRKLLEGIIKPNSPNSSRRLLTSPSGEGNSSGTRSVLDALKEISRKRIHTNEGYELNEDTGKRLRTEKLNENDSNKRLRDDSPLPDNASSPNKPGSKRICMYDEYAASCSSMDFLAKKSEQSVPKRKSISISTLTENPKDSKQVKLINVETQTIVSEDGKSAQQSKTIVETQEDQNENEISNDKTLKKKESPVKIFDDAPLERIRKNRLAALMGSLAGKDPVLAAKPDYAITLNSAEKSEALEGSSIEVPKPIEKPLISILASPKKDSSTRSNKHVHFSIPETTSQTILTTPSVTGFSITQSSPSITSPISSTCEIKSAFGPNKNEEKLETPAPPSSPVGLTPSSSETTIAVPALTFGNSGSATSLVSKESSVSLLGANVSKSDMAIPGFHFKSPSTSSTILGGAPSNMSFSVAQSTPSQVTFGVATTTAPSNTTSPPKMGGFKFDLVKPAATPTTATTSNTPTFSFGTVSQGKSLFSTTTTIATPSSTNPLGSTPNSFSFGSKNRSLPPSSTTPTTTTVPSALGPTMGGFSFGVNNASAAPSSTTTASAMSSFSTNSAYGTATTSLGITPSNTSVVPAFQFGPNNSISKSAGSAFGLTTSSPITFGSTSAPTSTFTFGAKTTTVSPVSTALATTLPAFGTSKPPVFSFGGTANAASKTSGFGITTTSAPPSFGAQSTAVSSEFRVTSTSSFGASSTPLPSSDFGAISTTSAVSNFGPPTTTVGGFATSAALMFGDNKPTSPFGVNTSTVPAFGTSSTSNASTAPNASPFGKSNTPAFGHVTTQLSFGAPTTTVSFGNASTFGGTTTTSSSVFGGPTSSPGFGKPTNTTNIFGGVANTQASGFGTANAKSLFGAAAASPFGSSAPTTTASAFGSNTTSTFNFGPKTTGSGTFGTGNVFGTTTTASSGFGTSTTPAFGTPNIFSSGSSSFGGNNAFGSSAPPAFATVTTTTQPTGFGTTNTAPTFGGASTGSVFGTSSTPAFGSTAAPSFAASAPASGFGMSNNASGFGANTGSAFTKPQSASFGSTSNAFGANAGFGANPNQPQAPAFGATNPPSTQTPVFSFGATTAPKPAGVFSFGAAPSNEPLKRTFDFSGAGSAPAFASTGAPSFGGTGTPSFGAPGVPQFAPPQPGTPGMFSIGSGSSTGRTRTQLKAKRRT